VKKNIVGIFGIAVAIAIIVLILSMEMVSPELVSILLAGTLIVVISGFVAAMRGSRLWLILTGVGIALSAFIIFGVVGP
jgi:hypothetical protein